MTPWIVAPLLLCVGVYLGVEMYCQHVRARLEKQRTVARIVPVAEGKLQECASALEDVVGAAVLSGDGAPVFRPAAELHELTHDFDLEILSIRNVQNEQRKDQGPAAATSLRVRTEGSLAGTVAFADALYTREPLLVIDGAEFARNERRDEVRYVGEFVIRLYEVRCPSTMMGAPKEARKGSSGS